MARDGSGDYSRVVTPPANGDVANATDFNSEINDIASALSDSINKAGTKAFAANQDLGGFIMTGSGAPSNNNDLTRKKYVDDAITGLSASYQPLDATLTALAALSYTSGTLVLTLTAADTFTLVDATTFVRTTGTQTVAGAKTFTSAVLINLNAGSLPTNLSGIVQQVAAADGAATGYLLEASANNPTVIYRRCNGTLASPSAVQATEVIGQFQWRGYGASAYSTARSTLRVLALENWTDSANGCYGSLSTTPTGSTTNTEIYRYGALVSSLEIGFRDGGPGGNSGAAATADYTFALADRGTPVDHNSASAHAFTIPPEASVAWPVNTILWGTNIGAGTMTLTRGSGVTFRNAAGTDADAAVTQYQSYYARKIGTNTWSIRVT